MVRLGADPELFAITNGGKYISLIGIIGGSKDEPLVIRPDGCAVQEDNVAAEFNIPPCASAKEFVEAINFNLDYLKHRVQSEGLQLAITASARFDKDQLDHPKAREFGCDPDYNAWTEKPNPRPRSTDMQLRSAGGHVHIETELNPYHVARCFDLYVVVPSLSFDADTRRRELYGKAGACRPKDYGVECRALSNFWLQSDELKEWVWENTQKAVAFAQTGYKFSRGEGMKIQTCINHSNIGLMEELIKEYKLEA